MSRPGSGVREVVRCAEVVLVLVSEPSEFSRFDRSRRRLLESRHPEPRGSAPRSCEAGPGGLALVSTQPLESRVDGELRRIQRHAPISQVAHLHAVRMVMLNLRQRAFLEIHADALARLDWEQSIGKAHREALKLEQSLIQFQNKFWVTRVPEKSAVGTVMGTLSEPVRWTD